MTTLRSVDPALKSAPASSRGRPAKGSLVWTKAGWAARITATEDGERVRRQHQLETTSRPAAQRKLARLLETANVTKAEAARVDTFAEAARRIVDEFAESSATPEEPDGGDGPRWRRGRLTTYAFPILGALPVTAIRASHVRAVLEGAAKLGRSRNTVRHLKDDLSVVLGQLWRDEIITENAALRVIIPKNAKVDERKRVVLTDPEFAAFMASPDVAPELHIMALVSRTFGGMRTSDLHAWSWEHIDLVTWLDAHVPRPKTKSRDRLGLPEMLIAPLQSWWDAAGRPKSGPVFPGRKGARAGKRRGKLSHARRLRDALWKIGVRRGATRAECELQTDTTQTRCTDFHSFRRAFATALGAANVNVQTAMKLAGHRSASTHMRYCLLAESLEMPLAALPRLKTLATAKTPAGESPTGQHHSRFQRNPSDTHRPRAPASASADAFGGSVDAWPLGTERQGSVPKPGQRFFSAPKMLDAELADLLLGIAMRAMANRATLGLRGVTASAPS